MQQTSPSLCDLVQLSTLLSQKPSGRTTMTDATDAPRSTVDNLMQDLATLHAPFLASTIKTNPFLFVSSLYRENKVSFAFNYAKRHHIWQSLES